MLASLALTSSLKFRLVSTACWSSTPMVQASPTGTAYQVCHRALQHHHTPARLPLLLPSTPHSHLLCLPPSTFAPQQNVAHLAVRHVLETRKQNKPLFCRTVPTPLPLLPVSPSPIKGSLSLPEHADLIPTAQHFSLLLPFPGKHSKSIFSSQCFLLVLLAQLTCHLEEDFPYPVTTLQITHYHYCQRTEQLSRHSSPPRTEQVLQKGTC